MSDEHHQAGEYIRVTGSGTFDPASGSIDAGGAWTHFGADVTVHMRGTRKTVSFTSFTPVGGPTPSELRGKLAMVAAHFDESGNPCACDYHGTGIPTTVTSSINPAAGWQASTTVGIFTDPTGGDVRFSLED